MAPCDARAPRKPLQLSPALQLPWQRCSLPLFSFKVPFYVGCPKKHRSKSLVQEAEHTWSHRGDPSQRLLCCRHTTDMVCSKPPAKGSKALKPHKVPQPCQQTGLHWCSGTHEPPQGLQPPVLTNTFIWICEPRKKFYW